MVEHVLREEAAALQQELDDHDTEAFTRRLAMRIAEAETEQSPRTTRPPLEARAKRFPLPARPLPRRGRRRRPTPIMETEPAVASAAVVREVRRLCDTVLRSDDIDRLADFAADYDQTGARTFACLLYTLDKWDSALYWWRFAAGAGDELAAHLLALHHAAVGYNPDARLWRAIARMMGFTPSRHLPQPVRQDDELAHGFARTATRDSKLASFLQYQRLPGELAAH